MDKSEKIMKKVAEGEELSAAEKKSLSYILDRAKEAEGEGGKVDKVMKKVRDGQDLSKSDKKTLAWATDRAKDTKNEDIIDEAKRIGNTELEKLIKKGKKFSSDIPNTTKKMNELNKYDKELYRKLYKANNIIERLNGWAKRVPTLRDMDDKGRSSAKKSLERIVSDLEKLSKEVNLSKVDKAIVQAQKRAEEKARQTRKNESFRDKVKRYLPEAAIDKENVMNAAYDMALEVYGDDVKSKVVKEMVDKALKKANSEKEAIGILKKMFRYE